MKRFDLKISISIMLLLLLFLLITCKKDFSTEIGHRSEGTILGGDARMCVCCGGWFIKIDNDTLRFGSLPLESNINLQNESFPLKVNLNWKKNPNACLGDEIIVLQIKKNNSY